MTEEGMKIYSSMLSREKERFRTISRKLMSQCMIVRDKSVSSRDDYIFISQPDTFHLLRETMEMHGYDVVIDRDAGVIRYYVPGDDAANRYNLSIRAKIILCVLLMLYMEKIDSKSVMDKYIEVRVSDVINVLEKYRLKERIGSDTGIRECLPVLMRFNLIDIGCSVKDISGSTPIRIYASIQFCLDEIALKEFVKESEDLIKSEAEREKASAVEGLKKAIKESTDDTDE